MKRPSIRSDVLRTTLIPIAVTAALLYLAFSSIHLRAIDQQLHTTGAALARQLSVALEHAMFTGNTAELRAIAQLMLRQPHLVHVEVADASGKVLLQLGSQPDDEVTPHWFSGHKHNFVEPVFISTVDTEDFPEARGRRAVGATAPAAGFLGEVRATVASPSTLRSHYHVLVESLAITLIALLVTSALGIRLARRVAAPVSRVSSLARQVTTGQLAERLDNAYSGELGQLVDNINLMVETLERDHTALSEHVEQLQQQREALQSEVVIRCQTEGDLRETQQRLEFLLGATPVVIYTCATEGGYPATFVSKNIKQVLGYTPEQFTEQAGFWLEHIHPADRSSVLETLGRLSATTSTTLEYRFQAADGSYRWMHDSIRLLRDNGGVALECIGFWFDASARHQAQLDARQKQAQLEQAGRLSIIGELGTTMSHELNQPLSAIVNYSRGIIHRLDKGQIGPQELPDVLRKVNAQAERAAAILQRLRRFANHREIQRASASVEAILAQSEEFIAAESADRNIAVEISAQPGLPFVHCDPVQIMQVVLNLLLNALDAVSQAAKSNGQVSVQLARDADPQQLRVCVSDNGIGLVHGSSNHTMEIFKPLHTTKPNGTGLGLPISRSIIESHGGRLWLECSVPGEGSTFCFTLPIADLGSEVP